MFKIACWNIRGLNESSKQKEVKNLIVDVVCVALWKLKF